MAIYHFESQVIGRGDGRSAVAAAAYRHAARMAFEREGRVADFSNKQNVAHAEFMVPEDAPAWVHAMMENRGAAEVAEAFWNRVEDFEGRRDAQLAKEFVLALPRELTKEQNVELVRDFIAEQLLVRGMVADWVYHNVEANPHIHIMTMLRPLTGDGFGGKKVPVLDRGGNPQRGRDGRIQYRLWAGDRATLNEMREAWAVVQNRHLARHGTDARVDHRSYAEQGIELTPSGKIGVRTRNIAKHAQAEGRVADLERLALHEEVRRENATRIAQRPEIAIDAISREKSVFDARDIAKYLHHYVDDPDRFQNLTARVMASPELVMLAIEGVDIETGEVRPAQFATRDMIRIEEKMARQAGHLAGNGSFGARAQIRNEILSAHSRLSGEQRTAIEEATGDERLAVIVGRAGAGKTTMMEAAREIWEASGYRVVGGALAGKAAEGLDKDAGIESRTLASWALQWERGRLHLDNKTVFVMDEAGMVGSRQMAAFVSVVAHTGAKLVLVGDPDQLQPIDAGSAFRALSDAVGSAELATIYRQHDADQRQASMDLARGKVDEAIKIYAGAGKLHGANTKAEALAGLIADWDRDYDPNQKSLILAHLRRDVRALNEMAREKLIARGVIEEGHRFQTADGVRRFAVGDQIVFLENEGALGVRNGMIGRVVEAERGRIVATVGDPRSGNPHSGEDLRRVEVNQHFYRSIDHGYATTIHKSQGATVDRVKVLGTLSLDRHLAYVAMTRHRRDMQFYYGRRSFAKAGGLVPVLSRRGAKTTTLQYAGTQLYELARTYANSRGLYGARVARAVAINQARWIARQRERLALASAKLAAFFDRLGRDRSGPKQAAAAAPHQPWLRGIATWALTVPQAVEARLQNDAQLTMHWSKIQHRMKHIYRKPEAAMRAMQLEKALGGLDGAAKTEQQRIVDQLSRDPEAFGALRGKSGLLTSRVARAERQRAMSNVPTLRDQICNFVRLRAEIGNLRTAELTRERDRQRIDVPTISAAGSQVLERVCDGIERNDIDASMAFALANQMARGEIDRLNRTLEEKFGKRAFAGREPKGPAFEAAAARVAQGDRSKLMAAWPMFHAAHKIAAHEQKQARQQARVQTQSRDQGMTR